MSQTVPLDNVDHAALKLLRGHGARFGEAVNQVAVVASEFDRVQREYPILFARTPEGMLQGVAILGFERDENLFIRDDGWDASYIPALFRRGPFQVGATGGEAAIHVDLAHPRIAGEGEDGDRVFKTHGGDAPVLEAAKLALRDLAGGARIAATLSELFDDLKLVEPVRLQVRVGEHGTVGFDGYLAVTPEAIARLEGTAFERLNRAGLLDVAVFAAASLGTMPGLVARKQRKLAGGG